MNLLDKIITHKRQEVVQKKATTPLAVLEQSPDYALPVRSLTASLLQAHSTGIIAEFKRKSPSKGFIQQNADATLITQGYTQNGAAGLSVLTDSYFFGGSNQDLQVARKNNVPILRKDFIVDEYQIAEAKSIGADVVLLIAACLTPQRVEQLAKTASSLGLETILELHAEEEMEHICDAVTMVGINNRDLKTFRVDIDRSLRMAAQIPRDKLKIAESGISSINDIRVFQQNGFQGFLIGEHFMKQADTVQSFKAFVEELKML